MERAGVGGGRAGWEDARPSARPRGPRRLPGRPFPQGPDPGPDLPARPRPQRPGMAHAPGPGRPRPAAAPSPRAGDAPGPRHARAIVSQRPLAGTPPFSRSGRAAILRSPLCLCRQPGLRSSRDAGAGLPSWAASPAGFGSALGMAHEPVLRCAVLPGKLTSIASLPYRGLEAVCPLPFLGGSPKPCRARCRRGACYKNSVLCGWFCLAAAFKGRR